MANLLPTINPAEGNKVRISQTDRVLARWSESRAGLSSPDLASKLFQWDTKRVHVVYVLRGLQTDAVGLCSSRVRAPRGRRPGWPTNVCRAGLFGHLLSGFPP